MANSGIFDSYAKHWLFDCVYSLIEKDYILALKYLFLFNIIFW